ncbi:hypothetical protein CO674_27260 [Rhizobium hidalgonense]|uniref:Uncharacterized protein n=1 Tax=Rhizobium hidalgonense TaxID=1538159 RepID=A0ABX4JKC9_9HYPH|nr:hypothetical protein CO674_27260 [Rhizobium hidalgonense]RWX10565.1 hypothetical protein EHI42_25405 [Rhizobium hidalgonense]
MGGQAVRVVCWVKTPPQPLPTRGRGYGAALLRSDFTAIASIPSGNEGGATREPSPLWGGLGGVLAPSLESRWRNLP